LPEEAALPEQDQEHHLSVHGRAPSHLEMFDYKPQLVSTALPPPELLKGYRAAFINPSSTLLGQKSVAKYGQSGAELSELLPYLSKVVDDIAIVKSMNTDAFNHAPGQILMNSGSSNSAGRAWARGSPMDWAANLAICPLCGFQLRLERAERPIRVGAAASCPQFIKACSSVRAAIQVVSFQSSGRG
jgi:hypothetical protein